MFDNGSRVINRWKDLACPTVFAPFLNNRFAPGLSYITYVGSKEERPKLQENVKKDSHFRALLTTYEVRDVFVTGKGSSSFPHLFDPSVTPSSCLVSPQVFSLLLFQFSCPLSVGGVWVRGCVELNHAILKVSCSCHVFFFPQVVSKPSFHSAPFHHSLQTDRKMLCFLTDVFT